MHPIIPFYRHDGSSLRGSPETGGSNATTQSLGIIAPKFGHREVISRTPQMQKKHDRQSGRMSWKAVPGNQRLLAAQPEVQSQLGMDSIMAFGVISIIVGMGILWSVKLSLWYDRLAKWNLILCTCVGDQEIVRGICRTGKIGEMWEAGAKLSCAYAGYCGASRCGFG